MRLLILFTRNKEHVLEYYVAILLVSSKDENDNEYKESTEHTKNSSVIRESSRQESFEFIMIIRSQRHFSANIQITITGSFIINYEFEHSEFVRSLNFIGSN